MPARRTTMHLPPETGALLRTLAAHSGMTATEIVHRLVSKEAAKSGIVAKVEGWNVNADGQGGATLRAEGLPATALTENELNIVAEALPKIADQGGSFEFQTATDRRPVKIDGKGKGVRFRIGDTMRTLPRYLAGDLAGHFRRAPKLVPFELGDLIMP